MKRPLAVLTGLALVAGGVLCSTAPAADAATYPSVTKALWVNTTLRVTYSAVAPTGPADDDAMVVLVDGKRIDEQDTASFTNRTVAVSRAASAGPAHVEVLSEAYVDDSTGGHSTPTTVYSATVSRHVVMTKRGQVSAATLLDRLKVAKESHAGSYARSRFRLWIDADHDGENTRAEVLKAESKKHVTENGRHTVKTGKWVSAYDGKTFTVASELDIDHLVPLEEAWTSGASSWSVKKRTAYANDLGYAASLIAVSAHENRSKGDDDPTAYLPSSKSDVCAYVRNYIAVKYRWGLSVDPAEKSALKTDLAVSCINPEVTKPGRPNIAALVGTSTTGSAPVRSTAPSSVYYKNCAAVRAAGKAPLYAGQPGYATPRLDRDGDGIACE
jgi:hypothetical protein